MPCVVSTCGASVGTFKPFPQQGSLSKRWLEAIQVGCGIKAADDGSLSPMELCHWHFAKPDGRMYQEPKIFTNCKAEKVEIDSCRFCLRFYPICDMVSKNGKLSGKNIKSIVYESLHIDFKPNDLLELICIHCLARLDLLQSIRKEFIDAELSLHKLGGIIRSSEKELREPIEMPLPVEVVMKEESYESNSEDSGDEWTPPKDQVDIPKNQSGVVAKRKSKSTSCNAPKQPKLSLTEQTLRKCYICQMILESTNDLVSHLVQTHTNKGPNRCKECSLDFPTLPVYNNHLSRHDRTERPHKCSFCSIGFKMKQAKLLHENTRHSANHDIGTKIEEKSKPAVCETCGESFTLMRKLRYHIQQKHSTNKPTCKTCEKTFTTFASLRRHMLVHTNEKPYVCSICGVPFRRLFDLKNHVQMVHEGKNPHFCAECNLEFKSYESLYSHKQKVHLKKRNPRHQSGSQSTCQLCGEMFENTSDLRQHISISHADESYPYFECSECPQKYIQIHSLYAHKIIHSAKHVCKECDKRFQSVHALKIHIESVHEKQQLNCPICLTKTYSTVSALRVHVATHTEEKRFACDFCEKRFHRNSQLTIHRRTHTGEKPFGCPKCSMRFGDDGTFSKHKKRCLATVVVKKEGKSSDNGMPPSS